jgi:hypothetical protein
VLKVSVNAVWTTVILLPTLWLGAIPGAPQRRAVDVVWQFFRHSVEVTVYIVYVSVIGLAVERVVAAPLPTELGGTSAFAHVLMMGAVSVAALLLGRHVRADLSGHSHRGRFIGRATDIAVGMGIRAGLGGAREATNSLRSRMAQWGAAQRATPWEQLDRAADHTAQVHGAPVPGVDPVPNAPDEDEPEAPTTVDPIDETPDSPGAIAPR